MGTPEFAVPSLKGIINSRSHKVAAVFSQRPKARGRGMMISESPIHKVASDHNIPVYTPSTLRSEESLGLIESIGADIIVVVAYGFIIPKAILESKKFGCLNVHPSKLPKYRGAAPLQRTIINGDKETAVCIMQMDEGLDTGDVILQKNFPISDRVTLQELHDNCATIGCSLLLEVLDNIETLPRIKQSEEGLVYAPKLTKEEGRVDWETTAFAIDCKVRGMNPWPGVFCKLGDNIIKIIESDYRMEEHEYQPGSLLNGNFEVACGEGVLMVKKVQPAGKGQVNSADYLRGIFNQKNFNFLGNNVRMG